ncbi:MAG: hypothetical protein GY864_14410 [Desulfobacterales bacterium]|nr:hypothetical protein [Desulfobacterales bacterium]
MELHNIPENKQELTRMIQGFIAQNKGTDLKDILKIVKELAEEDKVRQYTPTETDTIIKKDPGRWAKFANRIHEESPLGGLSEYVQACSKEFRKDFALNRGEA